MIGVDSKAIMLLEDGTIFHGISKRITGVALGEIYFNIGMEVYQEIFTDPSYFGQLVVCTNFHTMYYPLISKRTILEILITDVFSLSNNNFF